MSEHKKPGEVLTEAEAGFISATEGKNVYLQV